MWWVRAVRDVGFPIVAAAAVWTLLVGRVDRLTSAVERNTRATLALVCQLAPKDCVNAVRSTDLAGGAAP